MPHLSLPWGRVLNPLPSPRPFQKGKGCNRPTRCSEPLRSKVGGPSKVFAKLCGMGPPYYNLLMVWAMFCGMGPPGDSLMMGTAWEWMPGTGWIVPHCSIALHLSSLEWGILFLFYFWEDYLWGGSHQGYGGNLMTAIDHMFQNGTKEQCSIC